MSDHAMLETMKNRVVLIRYRPRNVPVFDLHLNHNNRKTLTLALKFDNAIWYWKVFVSCNGTKGSCRQTPVHTFAVKKVFFLVLHA